MINVQCVDIGPLMVENVTTAVIDLNMVDNYLKEIDWNKHLDQLKTNKFIIFYDKVISRYKIGGREIHSIDHIPDHIFEKIKAIAVKTAPGGRE